MAESNHADHLRPIERTVVRLNRSGHSEADIGWRLRRSPGWVRRTLALAQRPEPASPRPQPEAWDLRPIERRVVHSRERGIDEVETAARLRRSPELIQRIGAFADYKLAQAAGRSSS